MHRRQYVKGIGAAVTAGMAGCLGLGGGDNENFKIGMLQALSGPFAAVGESAVNGIEVAQEELNADDGIDGREIEVITRDTETTPETGTTRARELIVEEEVDILMGTTASSVGFGVAELASEEDIVFMPGVIAPGFTEEDCRRTTFRIGSANLRVTNRGHAQNVAELIGGTRVAGLHPNYSLGTASWEIFRERYLELVPEAEVVNEQLPSVGETDLRNQAQAIIDSDADVVHSTLFGDMMVSFLTQAQQFDFFEEIEAFTMAGSLLDITQAMGEDMPEVLTTNVYYHGAYDNEINNRFVSNYEEKTGNKPGVNSHLAYADALALNAGITESGDASTEGIIGGLEGLEFEGPKGTYRVREADHEGIHETYPSGWTGPVDEIDGSHGIAELHLIDGDEAIGEPRCEFPE